jgi:hypothetical protein
LRLEKRIVAATIDAAAAAVVVIASDGESTGKSRLRGDAGVR